MDQVLIVAALAVVVATVLLVPLWMGRRRQQLSSKLLQYQTVSEALLDDDLGRAREALKDLIRSDTEDIGAYLRLARILRREGDPERAVALYRSLKAREVTDRALKLQILSGLIEDLLLLGRCDEAQAEVEALKRMDRRHPLIRQVELQGALAREDWVRALKALDGLVRTGRGFQGPRAAQVRTFIAGRKAEAGQIREARKLLEEALRDEPDYGPALLLLGNLWAREQEHERAAEVWKRLLRARPRAAGAVIAPLEKAYFEMGRFSDLGVLYDELVASAPEGATALQLGRVRMALRRGDPEEALGIVEDLLAREPRTDGDGQRAYRDWRAFLLFETGRADDARQALKEMAETSLRRQETIRCGACGTTVSATAGRCDQCNGWLPDPFADQGHPGPVRTS